MKESEIHAPDKDAPSVTRLEFDLALGFAGIFVSLILTQWLHWRPLRYLTEGGACMLVGVLLNALLLLASTSRGQPSIVSLAVSPPVHDLVYFG